MKELVLKEYSFTFSLRVYDKDGYNILSDKLGPDSTGYYTKSAIVLESENEKETVDFEISESGNFGLLLNSTVQYSIYVEAGKYNEDITTHQIIVHWGRYSSVYTTDNITFEVAYIKDKPYCRKVWVNNKLEWEGNSNDTPVLLFIKEKFYDYVGA